MVTDTFTYRGERRRIEQCKGRERTINVSARQPVLRSTGTSAGRCHFASKTVPVSHYDWQC